jgi:hypothetical protein
VIKIPILENRIAVMITPPRISDAMLSAIALGTMLLGVLLG